jgi:hypothetical protein
MQLRIAISGVPVALIAFKVEKNMTASFFEDVTNNTFKRSQ